jgi:predicted ATPase
MAVRQLVVNKEGSKTRKWSKHEPTGYELLEIPRAPIDERASFVLDAAGIERSI